MTNAQVAQFGEVVGARDTRARRHCANLRYRSESTPKQQAHAAILTRPELFSPASNIPPDTVRLDLEGLASLLGTDEKYRAGIGARVARLGLAARVAVAETWKWQFMAALVFSWNNPYSAGQERHALTFADWRAYHRNRNPGSF